MQILNLRLLIGAPRDNITHFNDGSRKFADDVYDIDRPGAVYVCDVSSDLDDCELLSIYTAGIDSLYF